MALRKSKKKKYSPFSAEEWAEIRKYQKVPFAKKLAMLDRMRTFMFKLWKENPKTYQFAQQFRETGWR